jgi:hypothetical protein
VLIKELLWSQKLTLSWMKPYSHRYKVLHSLRVILRLCLNWKRCSPNHNSVPLECRSLSVDGASLEAPFISADMETSVQSEIWS